MTTVGRHGNGFSSSVLAALRTATRDAHDAVERVVPLMDPAVTRARYVAYLERSLGFYAPVEDALARLRGLVAVVPDLQRRRKRSLLERDLLALSGNALGALGALGAPCRELPPLATTADGLGCLYVLEGSTLGGQLLARHLGATLNVGAGSGAAFVQSYGAAVGPMWRAFGAALEAYAARTGEHGAIVASARATFETFTRWLAESAGVRA